MLCTSGIAKSTKERKFELYRFKVYIFTLHKIRVRLSADACTRLDKNIMIFNYKSGLSPYCDCVQSITVEQWTHFLNSKYLRKLFIDVENALSTNQAMSHDYMNSYILNFTI